MKYFRYAFLLVCLGLLAACEDDVVVPLSNAKSITKCVAHRGLVDDSDPRLIENSMSAFEAAQQAGADGTEFDIFLTQDGIPIVSHSGSLESMGISKPGKTCPVNTGFSGLTASEIKEKCLLKNGDEVPFLEDVFARFSGSEFYLILDFKATPNDKVIELMRRFYQGRYHLLVTLVNLESTFSDAPKLRSKLPTKLWFTSGTYKFGTENVVDGIEAMRLGDMDIALLHEKGKLISLYAMDSFDEIKHFIDQNVNFITTDSIHVCLEAKR